MKNLICYIRPDGQYEEAVVDVPHGDNISAIYEIESMGLGNFISTIEIEYFWEENCAISDDLDPDQELMLVATECCGYEYFQPEDCFIDFHILKMQPMPPNTKLGLVPLRPRVEYNRLGVGRR